MNDQPLFLKPGATTRRTLLKAAAASYVALPALSFAAANTRNDRGSIKFGQSAPLTGAMAEVGLGFRDAALAVFAEVNGQGGIGGRTIDLVTLDDESLHERTTVNVKLLVSEHKVVGLFGFAGSGSHVAGAKQAAVEGMPYIAAVSGSQELRTGKTPRVYNMRAGYADEIELIIRHMYQVGIQRVSLVVEYNSQGWDIRDTFIDAAEKQGNKVASISSIDHEGSAFSLAAALKATLAGDPQAVVLGADSQASAKFVDAARAAGYNGQVYTLSTVGGAAMVKLLGKKAEGVSVTQVVPFPWTSSLRIGREFQDFCARRKIDASFIAMEAYLASSLLVGAMKRTNDFTSVGVSTALANLPAYDFGGYLGSFYSKARRSPGQVDLTVYSRSGKFLK